MILADTSVWVEHLRRGHAGLREALEDERIAVHPFVQGELALGHVRRRSPLLRLIALLPTLEPASHDEVLRFVADGRLEGRGIGWIDAHLLAAAKLHAVRLWTLDRRLAGAAGELGLA
ncbi:MAG: PIN domain-containing protein [Phycisphaeraceae bacterium]|nr:MAG: PIN domain-containing protein [Phycisphaeraceae bacterium]